MVTGGFMSTAGGEPPVVVLAGPTASGKSALARHLAREFNGVIINADALQVYRELDILTARPRPEEMSQLQHRLYGVLSGAEPCSAGLWRTLAIAEIDAAVTIGLLPIVTGGTGLYLRALEEGLAETPEVPEGIRQAVRERHAAMGSQAMHAALGERDPVMAARLHPSDKQRILRAWEVFESSGRSLAEWQARTRSGNVPYRFLHLTLAPDREELYAACDQRFEAMVEAGALDEVRGLLDLELDPSLPIMKAVGVPQLASHLGGAITLEAALADGQQATRSYAKRQLTWIRNKSPNGTEVLSGRIKADRLKRIVAKATRRNPASILVGTQYTESLNGLFSNILRDYMLTPHF